MLRYDCNIFKPFEGFKVREAESTELKTKNDVADVQKWACYSTPDTVWALYLGWIGHLYTTSPSSYNQQATQRTLLESLKEKKKRNIYFILGPYSQSYSFSNSHVWVWELDGKAGWAPKSWCFWTVVLEKTLESPLNCKEIQPVNTKGNQSWLFIGRTDAEA